MTSKRIRLTLLLTGLLIIVSVVLFMKQSNKKPIPENSSVKNEKTPVIKEQNKPPLNVEVKHQKKVIFKTNEEIKQEYGKIETVHLWDGRNYTGAVVTSDDLYSIVTVKGIFKIPMKDVKLREIIR
jgi:hypothetical protein